LVADDTLAVLLAKSLVELNIPAAEDWVEPNMIRRRSLA